MTALQLTPPNSRGRTVLQPDSFYDAGDPDCLPKREPAPLRPEPETLTEKLTQILEFSEADMADTAELFLRKLIDELNQHPQRNQHGQETDNR